MFTIPLQYVRIYTAFHWLIFLCFIILTTKLTYSLYPNTLCRSQRTVEKEIGIWVAFTRPINCQLVVLVWHPWTPFVSMCTHIQCDNICSSNAVVCCAVQGGCRLWFLQSCTELVFARLWTNTSWWYLITGLAWVSTAEHISKWKHTNGKTHRCATHINQFTDKKPHCVSSLTQTTSTLDAINAGIW